MTDLIRALPKAPAWPGRRRTGGVRQTSWYPSREPPLTRLLAPARVPRRGGPPNRPHVRLRRRALLGRQRDRPKVPAPAQDVCGVRADQRARTRHLKPANVWRLRWTEGTGPLGTEAGGRAGVKAGLRHGYEDAAEAVEGAAEVDGHGGHEAACGGRDHASSSRARPTAARSAGLKAAKQVSCLRPQATSTRGSDAALAWATGESSRKSRAPRGRRHRAAPRPQRGWSNPMELPETGGGQPASVPLPSQPSSLIQSTMGAHDEVEPSREHLP